MANPQLKMPEDRTSELYYDANRLAVAFRKRDDKKKKDTARGTALRVVVQSYGWIIEDRFFDPETVVTVGSEKKNTLRIPTRDLPEFHPLIEYGNDGQIRLSLNKHFTGILQRDDKLEDLSDTLSADASPASLEGIVLPKGSKGVLEHGNLLIFFEEIPLPDRVPPPALFKMLTDPYFVRWLMVSLAFHLMLLLVIKLMPEAEQVVELEELADAQKQIVLDPNRFRKIDVKPLKGISALGLKPGAVGMEGEGARAPGREGRRGKGVPGAGRMSGKDINRTGVLDFFTKKGNKGVLSDLIGGSAIPGNVESAMNRNSRYGLPGERELREGKGLVDRGGVGGGGLSTSIGQGLGTKGRGGGAKGPGLADFGTGRKNVAVSASIDEEEVFIMGSIPKEVIAKIINDHIGQIRYCYERQVQVQPELKGKVVPTFIIGLQGRVTSTRIKKSSMGSPPVESCIQNVIRRIQFPKPGGGIVEVTFPFLFRVAG